jgi:uncharacterized membrane protein HdeD (DUF308 family)
MANRTRTATPLNRQISALWWIGITQAILAIIFGIITLFWPQLTLVTLVYLLGAFVIAIGVTEIVHALMSIGRRDTWWMTLLIGLVALSAGVYLARHPSVTFKTFILVVGITFIVRGVIDILRTFLDRALASHRVLSFIAGLAGLAAGIIILLQPISGGLAFVWVIGLYALIYGIAVLVVSMQERNAFNQLAGVV